MSEENLESLLDEEVEAEEELETEVEESNDDESEESATDESGETEAEAEATDEKTEGEPSSPEGEEEPLTKREEAFLKKANDEKHKRQELEQKYSNQPEKGQEALPDPIDDPEGYAKALQVRNDRNQLATRITLSQELMRDKHADYEEREAQFAELAKTDPSLVAQLQQASNPAKFAYETAVKAERVAQFDNFDDAVKSEVGKQVAAETARIRAEIEKEYSGKLNQAQKIPPSGAKAGSRGSDNSAVAGNDSLTDILGTKEDE